ncbi:acyl-CoA synthetase (AMP-forming)/AMP-acid ligase II [Bradyrhizobium sp. GM24.11]
MTARVPEGHPMRSDRDRELPNDSGGQGFKQFCKYVANLSEKGTKVDLCTLIERNASFTPDKPAIHFDGGTLSYAAFTQRIEQIARALKHQLGIERGDRVAILGLNRPDYLALLYACARLGAMLVPLNWRLTVAEQLFILSDARPKVLEQIPPDVGQGL